MTVQESAKHAVDAVATGTVVVTWLDFLPDVAAGLSIVWFLLRIWESETVKGFRGKQRKN
jgi:hypothetical protein